MKRDFTERQQQAIETDNTDICVAAGAGSGKTGVLVERFVRLITQGSLETVSKEQKNRPINDKRIAVDEILVITFTEKATREMKSRIVGELTKRRLTEERRQVETAYISTIHGFCSRLLRENPFEAGVDPQFALLDEPQARRLLRQSFDEVISHAYTTGDVEITELVAAMQGTRLHGDTIGDPLSALALTTETVIAKLRGAGRSQTEVERHWREGRDRTAAQALEPVWGILTPILTEVAACLETLKTLHSSLTGTARVVCDGLMERTDCLRTEGASLIPTIAALEETLKATARFHPRASGLPQEMELGRLFNRIKIVCEEAKDLYGVTAEREEQAGLTCHRLWGLVSTVWNTYNRAKRRRGQLDTDDLQAEAVSLLERSPVVGDRYRRHFRHLLVDEFQDTNPLQMRLIELLHVTPAMRRERPDLIQNHLFVVGDVQQSIYAFRHADPSLFRDLERRFRKGAGLHVPLSVNFRSRPEILRSIETVFRQVWRDNPTPFVPLTPGLEFDAGNTPCLEILLTQDLQRRDYVSLEADALATRIYQMVEGQERRLTSHTDPRRGEPVGYRDVAVMLRGLTDVQKYEEAFARRGVPYFVVGGGRGYYARHEIRDLLNVLTVLETPLDDVALAAALRSPLVGIDVDTLYHLTLEARKHPAIMDTTQSITSNVESEANSSDQSADNTTKRHIKRRPLYPAIPALLASGRLPIGEAERLRRFIEVLDMLRAQEDRLPIGHLLERLIAHTQYDARLLCRPGGRRRLANVRKLLQMANADSVMGVRDFIRRLRDLEKLSDREGDAPTEEEAADVVRILTIHGAKGLEFPVVVLADLARSLLLPERGLFVCEPQQMALGTRLSGEPNVVYKAIDARRRLADREEAARLLYVAMTRAREHLILCGNIGRNRGFNWADNVFPLIGVTDMPSEPEQRILAGGVHAVVAPLTMYARTARTSGETVKAPVRRETEQLADDLANDLLNNAAVK